MPSHKHIDSPVPQSDFLPSGFISSDLAPTGLVPDEAPQGTVVEDSGEIPPECIVVNRPGAPGAYTSKGIRLEDIRPGKAVIGYKSRGSRLLQQLGRVVRGTRESSPGYENSPDDATDGSFIMRRLGAARHFVVPTTLITAAYAEYIQIEIAADELSRLQSYELRPDQEVEMSVYQAFMAEKSTLFECIVVTVVDGVICLSGYVPSSAVKLHAGELARLVSRVHEVDNRIVVDG